MPAGALLFILLFCANSLADEDPPALERDVLPLLKATVPEMPQSVEIERKAEPEWPALTRSRRIERARDRGRQVLTKAYSGTWYPMTKCRPSPKSHCTIGEKRDTAPLDRTGSPEIYPLPRNLAMPRPLTIIGHSRAQSASRPPRLNDRSTGPYSRSIASSRKRSSTRA